MRPLLPIALIVALWVSAAGAEQDPRTSVELSFQHADGQSISGDVYFSLGDAAPSVGLSVGFDQVELSGDRGTAIYASFAVPVSGATLHIGRPRSAFDTGAHGGHLFAVPAGISSLVATAARNRTLDFGLRLDRVGDTFSYGASWHRITGGSGDVMAVSGQYLSVDLDAVDQVVVFGGAESSGSEDYFRLGSEVTTGAATAGVDLTYQPEQRSLSRSQIYVDYALNDRITLGLAGLRDEAPDADPINRLGMSAAFTTQSGSYVQGGVAGAPDEDALFDLAIGFRF